MTTIFLNHYGLFVLFLFCLGVTSVEFILFKEISKPLLQKLSDFQLKLQTKFGEKNFLPKLMFEYINCEICHATIVMIAAGILTGIITWDFNYIMIATLFSTPLAIFIKKLFFTTQL